MNIDKKIPWTFRSWIILFKDVDLPIGDLAVDIARDPEFPTEDYFGEILEYVSAKCHGDADVIETFTLAWSYYLASKDPSRPTPTLTSE